tara:strand:+ start:102 stop:1580 length:1479 start_codon:yes stop_codon:yes gene_type:complete
MKKIIENFNNIAKRTIFKVQNKTINNLNISSFNKYLITIIAALFLYLFYLLIPLLYDKLWLQSYIENKLLKEFKINLSISEDISYRILPSPHFLIKDSKILVDDGEKIKSIAQIKDFQLFLSVRNFHNKKKINLQKIVINNANFSLLKSDFKLFGELKNKKLSDKEIIVNSSNIFLKNNLRDTISIIKIDKTKLFFDNEKLFNFFDLKGEVFNIPFNFHYQNNLIEYEKFDFNSKFLKLDISNESTAEKNGSIIGKNIISFLNSKINTKYDIKKNLIIFESDNSRIDNSQVSYDGELSINPFNFNLNIDLDNHRISKLFNINSILIEFIKSRLLFNKNISLNTSINIKSDIKNEIFQSAKINFHTVNGKIDFNKTEFINNDIGSLQLSNSNLFLKNNELLFSGDLLIKINNSQKLFYFFNTKKSSRKNFKTIFINLDYNFFNNQIKFNNVKIDNKKVNAEFLTIIDGFNDNNLNNFIKSRRLINELLEVYAG